MIPHKALGAADVTMDGLQWVLDIVLALLLAATLFHAIRLERALGVLKRDRASLETLVATFNSSTREAQDVIARLRAAADGAGRSIARQTDAAAMLRDDLAFLMERGEKLADRMDHLVRAGRGLVPEPALRSVASGRSETQADETPPAPARVRSRAERDLLAALRTAH